MALRRLLVEFQLWKRLRVSPEFVASDDSHSKILIDKTRLLDRLKGQLNERQQKGLLRMFREGPEGFRGGLTAGKYSTITAASPATTTRDLADLVAKGALTREGERRHARYQLGVPLRPVPHMTLTERGDVVENSAV